MKNNNGFTLIELSIVLVIIGLVIGGVLVGQDLINSAAIRAQISQMEKYQAAVNTFRGKYGELPGDADAKTASMFGLTPRSSNGGNYTGFGDGNGLIIGAADGYTGGVTEQGGETLIFWQDLSTAGLIDGNFNSLATSGTLANGAASAVSQYLPAAKIGGGNYVYVWSGGWMATMNRGNDSDNNNYFGIAAVVDLGATYGWGQMAANAGLTVGQAQAIDSKIDDGLPQYGNVLALIDNDSIKWAPPEEDFGWGGDCNSAGPPSCVNGGGPLITTGLSYGAGQLPLTCYNALTAVPATYTMQYATNIHCALSFKFE